MTVRTPDFPSIALHALSHVCLCGHLGGCGHPGAKVKVVQRLLGHATAAMTLDAYGHLMNDDLAGVAQALGKAIEQARSAT
jgi:integrase